MVWAHIIYPKTRKYDMVDTSNIENFNLLNYTKQKVTERRKVIYKVNTPAGKKKKCQILLINGNREKLEEEIKNKRVPVPKLNDSQINDSINTTIEEDEQDPTVNETVATKKMEKGKRKHQHLAKKTNENEIVNAHLKANASTRDYSEDEKEETRTQELSTQVLKKKETSFLLNISSDSDADLNRHDLKQEVQKLRNTIEKLKNQLECPIEENKDTIQSQPHAEVCDVKNDKVYIGYDNWIKKIAARTTRKTKGKERTLFSPKKKRRWRQFSRFG